MDPVYAAQGSSRPHLDGERRCPLSLADHRHAGLPAHHRHCAGLALHQRSRLHRHGHCVRHHALRYRAVAADCAHFAARALAGVEHLRALRHISHAGGAERVLWLQRLAADRLFHSLLCLRPFGHCHRHRHVARRGEPLSLVRADLWRQAIGPVHPLPHHAQFLGIPRGARHAGRDDRVCAEYEPHRDGHR